MAVYVNGVQVGSSDTQFIYEVTNPGFSLLLQTHWR